MAGKDKGRRKFLGMLTATAISISGCLSGDNEEIGAENEMNDSADYVPGWAEWVPLSMIDDTTWVSWTDVSRAQEELPEEVYRETMGIPEMASEYGIEEQNISTVAGVIGDNQNQTMIFGTFDGQQVVNQVPENAEELGSYEGFQILKPQLAETAIAIDDGMIIVSPEHRQAIDASTGQTESLDEDEQFATLLTHIRGGFLGAVFPKQATGGDIPSVRDISSEHEPEFFAVSIDFMNGQPVEIIYLLYESNSDAEAALEEEEESISENVRNNEEDELIGISQEGTLIVIEIEADDFSFRM